MAHVEDRWFRTVTLPDKSTKRLQTARHGNGRRWRVRYADPDGREHNQSFDRKVDADRFRVKVEADVQRGTYVDPAAARITLRRYADGWLRAQTFDEATRDSQERRLRLHVYPVLGDQTLGQLAARPSAIQAWIRGLALASSTAGGVLTTLSMVMNAAVDDGLITRNPCSARSVRAPRPADRKVVPWTAAQVSAVRAALPERYRALADVGRWLGLRQGEAFGVAVDDVDFLRRIVHVRRQVKRLGNALVFAPPKGGKDREVPLPDAVGLRLSAHIAACPPAAVALPWRALDGKPVTTRLLFTTLQGKAITRTPFVQRHWHPALRKAGLAVARENGFHALRHYFASTLLYDGVDIRALAVYLGHHDPAFTLRVYAHLVPDAAGRMRAVIDAAARAEADGPSTAQEAEQWASAQVRPDRVVVVGVLPQAAGDQLVVGQRAEPAGRQRRPARRRGTGGDPGGQRLAERGR
jgi:integrase